MVDDDIKSELVNLTDVDLDTLLETDNPVLQQSLKKVIKDVEGPQEIVAGFNSAI